MRSLPNTKTYSISSLKIGCTKTPKFIFPVILRAGVYVLFNSIDTKNQLDEGSVLYRLSKRGAISASSTGLDMK